MWLRSAIGLICLVGFASTTVGQSCSLTESPCAVGLGTYLAAAPPWHDGEAARPVVIHLHGAGASAAAVMQDHALVEPIVDRGYVLVAPVGLARPGEEGEYWSLGARPPQRDEARFLQQILDDVAPRFHADRSRVFLTGFSMGAALVWRRACESPGTFAAYAPVEGGYWSAHANDCAGPVRLLLTQGWRDDAVPLEGRAQGADTVQDGILDGLQVWRRVNRCADAHADEFATDAQFWRRSWTTCAPGSALTFVLHPGGHEVPAGWAALALDWFEAAVPRTH